MQGRASGLDLSPVSGCSEGAAAFYQRINADFDDLMQQHHHGRQKQQQQQHVSSGTQRPSSSGAKNHRHKGASSSGHYYARVTDVNSSGRQSRSSSRASSLLTMETYDDHKQDSNSYCDDIGKCLETSLDGSICGCCPCRR